MKINTSLIVTAVVSGASIVLGLIEKNLEKRRVNDEIVKEVAKAVSKHMGES